MENDDEMVGKADRGRVAVFHHVCDDKCIFFVTFKSCLVAVFIVLFDEVRIYEYSLNYSVFKPMCKAMPVMSCWYLTGEADLLFLLRKR